MKRKPLLRTHTDTRSPNIKTANDLSPLQTVGEKVVKILPGIIVALIGAVLAWMGARFFPGVSALLIAILLGVLWRNLAPVPAALADGMAFSAKRLLRTGIVLLGFQLSLSSILDLGFGVLFVVMMSVVGTFSSPSGWAGLWVLAWPNEFLLPPVFLFAGQLLWRLWKVRSKRGRRKLPQP